MDSIGLQTTPLTRAQGNKQTSLSLQKGQVFEGEIIKFFPNQTAALRLGGMKMTARLEAALNAGEKYFFQVKQNDGIPRLQVLQADQSALKSSNAHQADAAKVLQALGLQDNKFNQSMLRFFQAEQLPFSREMIQEGAAVLKQANAMNAEGARLLSTMNQSGFPLTLETFQSLYQAENGKPLSAQIQQLHAALQQVQGQVLGEEAGNAVANVRQALSETISLTAVQPSKSSHQDDIVRLLQLTASAQVPSSVRNGAVSLLQKADILPAASNTPEWLSSFKQAVLNPENRASVQQLWPQVFSGQQGRPPADMEPAETFQTLMNRLSITEGETGRRPLQQLLTLFQQAGGRKGETDFSASRLQQMMQTLQMNAATGQERQALAVLFQSTFMNERAAGASQTAGQLTQILHQLGLHHENQLAQQQAGFSADASSNETLKQSLLQHINHLPASVREGAEALLHKISGQQLLAQDQNGNLHQTVLQLPLSLGGFQTDATVQWEGRKQKDGALHPDHCRILFYLDMEYLGETIADVQIQNRTVTVNVFNEKEKPALLLDLLQPYLKERLEEQHYTLNAVHWKQAGEDSNRLKDVYESYTGFEGVDVRI
ncbi:hypothetical protein [Salibacterium aidingense]|uniref:hypothetical protein n=1 Tax=Salibacterium aidingense TaxID=384933 RepID=UPI003BCDDBFE